MADYNPVRSNGVQPFTMTTSAQVTGGQVVQTASGDADNTCKPGTAAGKAQVIGVAAHDAASGALVSVWPIHGCIHELVCPGGVAVGAGVMAKDSGEIITATIGTEAALGSLLGICIKGCSAGAGNKARFVGRG